MEGLDRCRIKKLADYVWNRKEEDEKRLPFFVCGIIGKMKKLAEN